MSTFMAAKIGETAHLAGGGVMEPICQRRECTRDARFVVYRALQHPDTLALVERDEIRAYACDQHLPHFLSGVYCNIFTPSIVERLP